jgi:predicted phage-related endonuclease
MPQARIKWSDGHIEVKPPRNPKKITGTRFANIMGLSPYKSPFATWCEITRTYEEPFEDTIYTIAGKTIEPKQAEFMRLFSGDNLITPTDKYGKDYFKTTRGDFFPEDPVLGGMWDYLVTDENGKPETVYEMKTTKRPEDWAEDIPEYYALQAALYAYLLGVDNVCMVCSILDERTDYANPEKYVPTFENTILRPFKVSERYPNMADLVGYARTWWAEHVETGVSPDYNEKDDAAILKELRTNKVDDNAAIEDLIKDAETLKVEIDAHNAEISAQEKKLKAIQEKIKEYAKANFREGDTRLVLSGPTMDWTYAMTTSTKVDEDLLKADGLYEKYSKPSVSYRLTCATRKE